MSWEYVDLYENAEGSVTKQLEFQGRIPLGMDPEILITQGRVFKKDEWMKWVEVVAFFDHGKTYVEMVMPVRITSGMEPCLQCSKEIKEDRSPYYPFCSEKCDSEYPGDWNKVNPGFLKGLLE